MKPTLVEEEDDDDMPDSGSMKSVSQSYTQHARSGPSDAGSRAACDAIQGVAPAITATTEREVEVRIEYSSEVDDEVLKEKSMHLPMRCNYWEATDRLPTLAPKKTQATQSSWGSDDVGEEKKVTFAEVEPQGHGKKSAASAVNLPTQKNHTHSSYASLPQAQSVGLSAEGNEFEIWDDTMGVAAEASKRSEGKHPTQSESCNLNLKSEKPKCSCGRITSLCARHRRACCCCGVSLGFLCITTAICLGLFWPRDPTWKVTKLQVNASELRKLVTAVSGSDLNLAPQSLLFVADVEVYNPNLVGGESDEGQLYLTYNNQRMGTGKMENSKVSAQSAVKVQATMDLDLPLEFVRSIQSELEADRAALVFKAFAEAKVESGLGMQINFKVVCDIDVSLSFLMMKETQDRAVSGRNCQYSFF